MANRIDRNKVEHLKNETLSAKSRLIEVHGELLSIGAIKDAEQLERIIIRLETWQNK